MGQENTISQRMNVDRGQKSRATPGSPNRDIQPIAFVSELGPIRKILELAANRR